MEIFNKIRRFVSTARKTAIDAFSELNTNVTKASSYHTPWSDVVISIDGVEHVCTEYSYHGDRSSMTLIPANKGSRVDCVVASPSVQYPFQNKMELAANDVIDFWNTVLSPTISLVSVESIIFKHMPLHGKLRTPHTFAKMVSSFCEFDEDLQEFYIKIKN
jgi:hypothetical protein